MAFSVANSIPMTIMNADWKKYGRSAGCIRNAEMAKNAEALIALWDGKSKGTINMLDNANEYGLKMYLGRYDMENRKVYKGELTDSYYGKLY